MKIYLSASLINSKQNKEITGYLRESGHEVFVPEEFCPVEQPHETFPEAIFRTCLEKMKKCDVGLIILDSYSRDSSSECGWFGNSNKALIGFISKNDQVFEDWMIKGWLDAILTTNEVYYNRFKSEDFFRYKPISFFSELVNISEEIEKLYYKVKNE